MEADAGACVLEPAVVLEVEASEVFSGGTLAGSGLGSALCTGSTALGGGSALGSGLVGVGVGVAVGVAAGVVAAGVNCGAGFPGVLLYKSAG